MSRLTLIVVILLFSLLSTCATQQTGASKATLVVDEFSQNALYYIRPYLDTTGTSWFRIASPNLNYRFLDHLGGSCPLSYFVVHNGSQYCYEQVAGKYGANMSVLVGAELTLVMFRSESWKSVTLSAKCKSGSVDVEKWGYWNSYNIYQDEVYWKNLPSSRRWIYNIRCPSKAGTHTTISRKMIIIYSVSSVGAVLIIVLAVVVIICLRKRRRVTKRIFQTNRQNIGTQEITGQPAYGFVTHENEYQKNVQREVDLELASTYLQPTVRITGSPPTNTQIEQSFQSNDLLMDENGYQIVTN